MNATTLFSNAVKSVQKPAVIGFIAILGLGLFTIVTIAFLALLSLLITALVIAIKAAIYTYLFFIAGIIAFKFIEQYQTKETPIIAILPPCKPCQKQIETIQNQVVITPLSAQAIFEYYLVPKQPIWQQQILKEIKLDWELLTETQEVSQPTESLNIPATDNALRCDIEPLNNQLTVLIICWQAIAKTSKLLDKIKASELKSIASELKIPKYRQMNKSQLLLEIIRAHDEAPEFSE